MRNLDLPLSGEPFEVMETGEKLEEYRTPTEWIMSRLFWPDGTEKQYAYVFFSLGYKKGRRQFFAEYLGFEVCKAPFKKTYSTGFTVNVYPGDIIIKLKQTNNNFMLVYWNGERKAQAVAITYEVTESTEHPFHWQNRFIGTRRQGLKIDVDGETFIIDNEYGEGYFKVTTGKGSKELGHKSVENPKDVKEIKFHFWNKKVKVKPLRAEQDAYMEWIRVESPETYHKLRNEVIPNKE